MGKCVQTVKRSKASKNGNIYKSEINSQTSAQLYKPQPQAYTLWNAIEPETMAERVTELKKGRGQEIQQKFDVGVEAWLDEKNNMKLSVGVPDLDGEAPPIDLVCIMDMSGSMRGTAACQTDGKTEYEDLGFSLNDLVKHAVKTVFKVLRPQDRASLILFSNQVRVYHQFTQMTDENRNILINTVEGIYPQGATNIRDAIACGMQMILERDDATHNAAIMFFTDGQPTQGYGTEYEQFEKLQKYKEATKFNYPIHTMCFGQYNKCSTDFLLKISEEFDGMIGYIQDARTVGTVFINAIGYTLATAVNKVQIQIFPYSTVSEQHYRLSLMHQVNKKSGSDTHLNIPGLRYGQTSDHMFTYQEMNQKQSVAQPWDIQDSGDEDNNNQANKVEKNGSNGAIKSVQIKLTYFSNGQEIDAGIQEVPIQKCSSIENQEHVNRFRAIQEFKTIIQKFEMSANQPDIEPLEKRMQTCVADLKNQNAEDEFTAGLIDTMERQTLTMLKKQKYMEKWGLHQLRHLMRSLVMQCKGNFRDQCLKDFGGELFNNISDTADDIYNTMDPPKASLKAVQPVMNAQQFANQMNNNNDEAGRGYYGGGCFAGTCKVLMADGGTKEVRHVVKGDLIATPEGSATVRCVVKRLTPRKVDFCKLEGGLLITPGHPVKVGNSWVYPRDLTQRQTDNDCEAIYNFVVDKDHIAIINGVQTILLGHNYEFGVLKHRYYGSQRVIDDLRRLRGFENGFVTIEEQKLEAKSKLKPVLKLEATEFEQNQRSELRAIMM